MKFVVLVKQVPDTGDARKLDLQTGLLDRAASDLIPDEITERALECALRVKDADSSTEVVALSVGPEEAEKSIRRLLAMGADRGVHIVDGSLAGSDMLQTAKVIAAAIKNEGFDVVLAGNQSTDGRGGMVPSMVAELLGVVGMPDLDAFEVADGSVQGSLRTVKGDVRLEAAVPVVASVTERAAEARFPTFKGIMAAKKKIVEKLSLSDLSVQAGPAYAPVRSVMVSAATAPSKQAGITVVDDGSAAAQLADFLESKNLL
jgi:electron transfer flavoprotein beta subunit